MMPKWIDSITFVDQGGYHEVLRRSVDYFEGKMQLSSGFSRPRHKWTVGPGPREVLGYAFGDGRAIAEVDVSAAWTSIMTLALADGGLIGIQFSNIALGNDWEAGGGAVLTWLRPGHAHVTVEVGPRWTLGGLRYTSFDEQSFRVEPGIRSVDFAVQGQWQLSERFDLYVRLDGMVLVDADVRPLGFLPTGSTGVAWLF